MNERLGKSYTGFARIGFNIREFYLNSKINVVDNVIQIIRNRGSGSIMAGVCGQFRQSEKSCSLAE